MTCPNCLNCIGYVDGELGAIPGDNVSCNSSGQLQLDPDVTPLADNIFFDDDTVTGCENGIKRQGSNMWMAPESSMGCFSDSASGFRGPDFPVGTNQAVFVPPRWLALPAADECYDTRYMISVQRYIRFDQSAGTDYAISDYVNGVLSPQATAERFTSIDNRHFTRHSVGFTYCIRRDAGSGPFALPFSVQIRTHGSDANSVGIIYQYGWTWCGLKIAMRGF